MEHPGGGMNAEMWLSHADETRPQRELQRAIWDELRWASPAAGGDVQIVVENFVARLSGTVPSYSARLAVQQAAERVPGVRVVLNRIAVVLPQRDARADAVLETALANAFSWDVRVRHTRITARVIDGWVTLVGSAGTHAERDAAEEVASNLIGVCGITNQIDIEPLESPVALRRQAEEAVEHARLRGARLTIDAHDRTVALRGQVHSLADRRVVERAVWAVPGIAAVEDLVTVR